MNHSETEEKYIDNDYIFYCGICHQMKCVEHRLSIHVHLYQCKKENVSYSQDTVSIGTDKLFDSDDIPKYIEKITNSEYGPLIVVYDIGRFIFDYYDLIKNKSISVIQVPHFPIPDKTIPLISLKSLQELDNIKRIYPSGLCATSYPCQHSMKIQSDDNKWYECEGMMGADKIWKDYGRYLPASMRTHFHIYDSMNKN